MSQPPPGLVTGILRPELAAQKFRLSRHAPAAALCDLVQHYWIVRWNLPAGDRHLQETLPYPAVNLVVGSSTGPSTGIATTRAQADVFGVFTQKYINRLSGIGRVFGIKFQPGGFYPFARFPMTALTNRTLPLTDVFGAKSQRFPDTIFALTDERTMVDAANQFLRDRLPKPDETVALINHVVEQISTERTLTRVETVAERVNISPRTLQRLFRQYVGVSPKWVIRHFRLHEATARLDSGDVLDLTRLALDLGYFDQAHFVKDFTAVVGVSPTVYVQLGAPTGL